MGDRARRVHSGVLISTGSIPTLTGTASSARQFTFASKVSFERVTLDTRDVFDHPSVGNKVGALLMQGGLAIMSGFNPDSLGPNDSILLPGMPGPGTVTTSVSSQVVSPSPASDERTRSRDEDEPTVAAVEPVLLATGSGSSGQPDSTIVLRLHLTGAGAAAIAGAHPPLLRLHLTAAMPPRWLCSASALRFSNWRRIITRSPTGSSARIRIRWGAR